MHTGVVQPANFIILGLRHVKAGLCGAFRFQFRCRKHVYQLCHLSAADVSRRTTA